MSDASDETPTLTISFSFDSKSGLFQARLENGARFSFSPLNVLGKLGENLDLLKAFSVRNAKGEPPRPHVCAKTAEAKLVEDAIASGKLQKVGVVKAPKLKLSLEDLGL